MGSVDERLLRYLFEGTASHTGQEFFQALVRSAAQALGVSGVWVTEFFPDQRVLRALAFWFNDAYIAEYQYRIDGSPCEVVIENPGLVHYPDRVIELFPGDPDLPGMNAVSYLGLPLIDIDGAVLGHLAALDSKPLDLNPQVEAVFQIFGARAAAELRRLRAENEVRESEERFSRLFDSAMDAIVELDEGLNIRRANASAKSVFSPSASHLRDLLTAESLLKFQSVVKDLDELHTPYAWIARGLQGIAHDRKTFNAEASVSRFHASSQRRYGLILRSVQDQLDAENRLRELEADAAYLQSEVAELHNNSEILGQSRPILGVLSGVRKVAPTTATVLITGETGTGKELVARAIHAASPRAPKPLIRVNCSAIPAALTESEFFGHEKGAFTGAANRRTGRFELAHGGTIFLDEIGELPLDLQPKLLRVLQEGEFEPVGSSHTRKVDVRVIAATNRDLLAEVKAGRFREDLYYRLNVFPIRVPPLRERGADIELLARTLVDRYARQIGSARPELTPDSLRRLRTYDWPGNVRELENLIERAVILAGDSGLSLADVVPAQSVARAREHAPATEHDLKSIERDTLIRALERANWKVAGDTGAARALGIPPSTLASRMKALGIRRPR